MYSPGQAFSSPVGAHFRGPTGVAVPRNACRSILVTRTQFADAAGGSGERHVPSLLEKRGRVGEFFDGFRISLIRSIE
jgi:hypothetical protein